MFNLIFICRINDLWYSKPAIMRDAAPLREHQDHKMADSGYPPTRG